MQQAGCLNCGLTLTREQKYCPNCGQKKDIHRLTFAHFFHEFMHAFTHVDKGILFLLKELAIRPGTVAAEFVEGKRKKYFNPFTFLALCVGFLLLINGWVQPYNYPEPDPQVLARIPDEHTRQLYITTVERNAELQQLVNKKMNIVAVIVAPFYALLLWLFFKKRGRNIPEIALTYILFVAFANVVASLLFAPLLMYFKDSSTRTWLNVISFYLQTIYFAWGLKTFFGYRSASGFFKVLGVLVLGSIISFIFLLIFLFFYVYRGESFRVLRYLTSN